MTMSMCDNWEMLLEYSQTPILRRKGGPCSGYVRHRGLPLNGMAALSYLAQRLSIVTEEDIAMKDLI